MRILKAVMLPHWIIEKKRDGLELTGDEIVFFISRFTAGEIPDSQMAALAMAVYFCGMNEAELAALTSAMLNSGEVLDFSAIGRPVVDKHSTGGIGDKVSLVLAPLVACCGAAVPMLSGRGLGITGGTLDKLESIPGFRTDLAVDELFSVVETCGCAISGQTASIVPADRKLYALRDLTGTVPSIPLITASIMSKKLAESPDGLVLDVKTGRGAFMKELDSARELARTMVKTGERSGVRTAALLSAMDQPLGTSAGNALEVIEAIALLQAGGPPDTRELVLALGERMLVAAGIERSTESARKVLEGKLSSGGAFECFRQMVELQGGDPRVVDEPARLPQAPVVREIRAEDGGWVGGVDADAVGRVCVMLGGGRKSMGDRIDHSVGVSGLCKVGAKIAAGDVLMLLHASNDAAAEECTGFLKEAVRISADPVPLPALVLESI